MQIPVWWFHFKSCWFSHVKSKSPTFAKKNIVSPASFCRSSWWNSINLPWWNHLLKIQQLAFPSRICQAGPQWCERWFIIPIELVRLCHPTISNSPTSHYSLIAGFMIWAIYWDQSHNVVQFVSCQLVNITSIYFNNYGNYGRYIYKFYNYWGL